MLHTDVPYGQTPSTYPRERKLHVYTKTCMRMFWAVLLKAVVLLWFGCAREGSVLEAWSLVLQRIR